MEPIGNLLSEMQKKMPETVQRARLSEQQENDESKQALGCEICGGLGWYKLDLPRDSEKFGRLFPCKCRAPERIAQLAELSGLKEHETHKLDALIIHDDDVERMLTIAREFVRQPQGWVYLWGGPGNGKSLVLQGVVNELVQRGVPALYTTFSDLLDLMRQTFGDDTDESYNSRFWRFQSVDVLAIDEFEKVNETRFVWEFRSKLVDHRYRDAIGGRTATLFASNSDPAGLPDWIYSRIRDDRFTIFHNTGGDVRMAASWDTD